MRRRLLLVALAVAAALAAALALPGPLHRFFFDENLLEVVPGEVYRSAQPDGPETEAFIERLGLRSILNLRGERGRSAWLVEERAAAAAHGVEHHTVRLSAKRMPPSPRLREIVEILDTAPRPLLFHCQGGVERSGLIGAVAVLLDGGDLAAARAQFSPAKGFVPAISRSEVPRVLDDYERWLAERGEPHTPDRFRAWVARDYHPYFYKASLAPVGTLGRLVPGQENALRVRVTNQSLRPIPFRATRESGVHLGAMLRAAGDEDDGAMELRDGFVDLDLAPGATHEFELVLPPLEPGAFRIVVDLVDEGVKWFEAMGSTPLELDLVVAREG
jgi:hypothetical protein